MTGNFSYTLDIKDIAEIFSYKYHAYFSVKI